MNIRVFQNPKDFGTPVLIEIGRRLDQERLEKLKLVNAVAKAEIDAYWRLKAASEILKPWDYLSQKLMNEVRETNKQMVESKRGKPRYEGAPPQPRRNRLLPPAGSLMLRPYRHRHYQPHGTCPRFQISILADQFSSVVTKCNFLFRFLVIDPLGELLLLEDPNGNVIYRNPSAAVRAATGLYAANGWDFWLS